MPLKCCVVEDCDQISYPEMWISIHTSPAISNTVYSEWKRLMSRYRKKLQACREVWRCSLHFVIDGFTRAVHIKGTERRVTPGSISTIWKVEPVCFTERIRRRVSANSVNASYFSVRQVASHVQLSFHLFRSDLMLHFISEFCFDWQ